MNKRKLLLSTGAANTFEWYDYALFGQLAPILGSKFFPASDPKANLLQAFLVFAVGYLMRPFGGIFFGIIGDRFGRKTALSLAIMCMAFPTAMIGLLPTYDSIGISATISMIVIRMIQGLSMGGALTGSVAFSIEHASLKTRGFIGSISMSSICLGILLGSAVISLTKTNMTPSQFDNWGWRLPFLIGIVIVFVGLYIRNHTAETPIFEKAKRHGHLLKSPLKKAFVNHWFDMIISILINSTGSVIFYLQAIYISTYLKFNRNFNENDVDNLINICYLIMAVTTLFAGWLSDKIGRRQIYVVNLILIIILTPFLINIFQSENFVWIIVAQVILAILAATYIGPEPALQAEFYPTNIRNTALAVSYNTATSLFGGTTPYVLEYLLQKTGTFTSCIYYIVTCAVLSLIALAFYRNRNTAEM